MDSEKPADAGDSLLDDKRPWFYVVNKAGHRLGGVHPDRFAAEAEFLLAQNWPEDATDVREVSTRRVEIRSLVQGLEEKQRLLAFLRALRLKLEDPSFGFPRTAFLVLQPSGKYAPGLWSVTRDALQVVRARVGPGKPVSSVGDAEKLGFHVKALTLEVIHESAVRCLTDLENRIEVLGAIEFQRNLEIELRQKQETKTVSDKVPSTLEIETLSNEETPTLEITDF